jgi:hypothetical protein
MGIFAVIGRVSNAYENLLAATEINACNIDVLYKVSLFPRIHIRIYPLFFVVKLLVAVGKT